MVISWVITVFSFNDPSWSQKNPETSYRLRFLPIVAEVGLLLFGEKIQRLWRGVNDKHLRILAIASLENTAFLQMTTTK